MEDVDWGLALPLLGHMRYVPQAVVRHVGSATSGGQRSAFALFYGHRNMVWTFVKNMPLPLLLLLLPLHVMANLAVIFLYVLRGQPGPVLRAKHTLCVVCPTCGASVPAFSVDNMPSLARTG